MSANPTSGALAKMLPSFARRTSVPPQFASLGGTFHDWRAVNDADDA
jgi:hypothetical protein